MSRGRAGVISKEYKGEENTEFHRNGEPIKFCYKNRIYTIAFKEVKVYIQAYAAYCLLSAKKQLSALPKVLMIDIGGFTVDYMLLRYGRLEMEHVDSLENGVICLYNNIKASIRQKYSILLEEEDIDCFSDIEELARNCRFSNCTHTTEPRCAVQNAIKNGILQEDRLGWIQFKRNDTSYGM